MQTKPDDPDIMSALIEPLKDKQLSELELKMLQGDSRLIIVAGRYVISLCLCDAQLPLHDLCSALPCPGINKPFFHPRTSRLTANAHHQKKKKKTNPPPSDTTAATLTHTFYHLAASPTHQSRLLAELRPLIQPDGSLRHRDIQDLPHLNGIINEALRLHPAVPTALQRVTPPEGLVVDGAHVPGNAIVWCPAYAIGRSAAAYVEPDAFCPERWYDEGKKGWVRKERAFAPFSTGVYGCVGRPLALMELRLVVAKVVAAFEVGLAEGETGETLLKRSRDHFTFECGQLRLTFKERAV